jgi:hypothetical protein
MPKSRLAPIICFAAAVAAVPAGLAGAASSRQSPRVSASRTETLHVYDAPERFVLTGPNGKTIKLSSKQPGPGDVLDVYSLEYVGNHSHHAAHSSMSAHLRCVFGKGQSEPTCESDIAIDGSLLVFHGNTLAGGTGIYAGATGRVLSNKTIGKTNDADIVARITTH